MFKTKLEIFIAKRTVILFILMTCVDLLLLPNKWNILLGMAIGGVFGLLRLNSTSVAFAAMLMKKSAQARSKSGLIKYIISQVATFALLFASIKFNLWFFFGVVGGILFVPAVIMINSFTEALGITHNNYE